MGVFCFDSALLYFTLLYSTHSTPLYYLQQLEQGVVQFVEQTQH